MWRSVVVAVMQVRNVRVGVNHRAVLVDMRVPTGEAVLMDVVVVLIVVAVLVLMLDAIVVMDVVVSRSQ